MVVKLRDEMATMRWKAWEEFAQSKREDVTIEVFYEYTKVLLEEYPKLDVEFEKTTILQK